MVVAAGCVKRRTALRCESGMRCEPPTKPSSAGATMHTRARRSTTLRGEGRGVSD